MSKREIFLKGLFHDGNKSLQSDPNRPLLQVSEELLSEAKMPVKMCAGATDHICIVDTRRVEKVAHDDAASRILTPNFIGKSACRRVFWKKMLSGYSTDRILKTHPLVLLEIDAIDGNRLKISRAITSDE